MIIPVKVKKDRQAKRIHHNWREGGGAQELRVTNSVFSFYINVLSFLIFSFLYRLVKVFSKHWPVKN